MGDFAVAIRTRRDGTDVLPRGIGRALSGEADVEMIDGIDDSVTTSLATAEWAGYAGVRDATTTSMPDWEEDGNNEPLPPWQEMVELRYGVHAAFWGRGVAGEAARAVMQWAGGEAGARRFIAETERTNARSASILRKLGFAESGTAYWQEPSEVEWEKRVVV